MSWLQARVQPPQPTNPRFEIRAGAPSRNVLRLCRALSLPQAILLEGPPGVGKSAIVGAMAAASGHVLTRVNLSESTELMDLLGADLPDPEGGAGAFKW